MFKITFYSWNNYCKYVYQQIGTITFILTLSKIKQVYFLAFNNKHYFYVSTCD